MFEIIYSILAIFVTFISIFVISANVDRRLTLTDHPNELMILSVLVVACGVFWPLTLVVCSAGLVIWLLMALLSYITTLFH
jgi:hypothetical protein